MNILITGGAGFIGSNLADKLLEQGNTIICIDNFDHFYDPEIKRNNISLAQKNNNYHLEVGDIRDKSFLQSVFSKYSIDIVYHLAARAGVRPSIQNPELYFDVNVNGSLKLLEVMKEMNCKKLIFASSSSVYGDSSPVPFSENDPADKPISPYAASKRAGEVIAHTYHILYGFDIFCMRFFTVYGPRQRPEMAIHNFTDKIFRGEPIKMFGDGSSRRDYTYIDDILEGLLASKDRIKGFEIINLGESDTISLKDLISEIEKVSGKKAIIEQLPKQAGDVRQTNADIRKAQDILEYKPQTPVRNGLSKFFDWYFSRQ